MPKVLTRLRIDEVSAVDHGAGDGVRVLLMKRKTKEDKPMSKFLDYFTGHRESGLDPALNALAKSVGLIVNSDDDDNTKKRSLAETFTQFQDYLAKKFPPKKDGDGDDGDGDGDGDGKNGNGKGKPPMFKELAKTLGLKEDASDEALAKAIGEALTKRDDEIALLKADLTEEELDYYKSRAPKPSAGAPGKTVDGMKEGDVGGDGIEDDDDALDTKAAPGVVTPYSRPRSGRPVTSKTTPLDGKRFLEMSHSERKEVMRKTSEVPAWMQKLLDDGAKAQERLAKLEDERELQKFEKVAAENGLPTTEASKLMKLSKVDTEALNSLLKHAKAGWTAAEQAGAFREVGHLGGNGGADTTAYGEMMAKAKELMKLDPKLTEAQAFTKVFTDPANATLAKRERSESAPPVVNPSGTM